MGGANAPPLPPLSYASVHQLSLQLAVCALDAGADAMRNLIEKLRLSSSFMLIILLTELNHQSDINIFVHHLKPFYKTPMVHPPDCLFW